MVVRVAAASFPPPRPGATPEAEKCQRCRPVMIRWARERSSGVLTLKNGSMPRAVVSLAARGARTVRDWNRVEAGRFQEMPDRQRAPGVEPRRQRAPAGQRPKPDGRLQAAVGRRDGRAAGPGRGRDERGQQLGGQERRVGRNDQAMGGRHRRARLSERGRAPCRGFGQCGKTRLDAGQRSHRARAAIGDQRQVQKAVRLASIGVDRERRAEFKKGLDHVSDHRLAGQHHQRLGDVPAHAAAASARQDQTCRPVPGVLVTGVLVPGVLARRCLAKRWRRSRRGGAGPYRAHQCACVFIGATMPRTRSR